MPINLTNECESSILESFLRDVLQEEYYADEQKPDLFQTMDYIKSMNQEVLYSHIFSMLFQYQIKNAVDFYVRLYDKLKLTDLISELVEMLNEAKEAKYIDQYSIIYNYNVKNAKSITLIYHKDHLEYSMTI
jgi:hypothetical protein